LIFLAEMVCYLQYIRQEGQKAMGFLNIYTRVITLFKRSQSLVEQLALYSSVSGCMYFFRRRRKTVDHVILQCRIHRPPHGLHGLTVLDHETAEWLLNT